MKNLRGDIRIPLSDLSDEKRYAGLLATMKWLVERLEAMPVQIDA